MKAIEVLRSLSSMRISVGDDGDMLSNGEVIGRISHEGITHEGRVYSFGDIASIAYDLNGNKQGFGYIPRLLDAAGNTIATIHRKASNPRSTGISMAQAYLDSLPHGTSSYAYPDVVRGCDSFGIERADVVKEVREYVKAGRMSLVGDSLCWAETRDGIPVKDAIEHALKGKAMNVEEISEGVGIALLSVMNVMYEMARKGNIAHGENGWRYCGGC